MVTTIVAVLASLGVTTLIGLIVGRLIEWRRPMTSEAWIDAPFLGLAGIVVGLQGGWTLGFPVRQTIVPFLILCAAAGVVLIARRQFGSQRDIPVASLAVAGGVYVLQAVGLWVLGVESY